MDDNADRHPSDPRPWGAGDRRAEEMRALLDRLQPHLGALFRRHGVLPAPSEDILQTVLLRLVEHWHHVADPAGYVFAGVRRGIRLHFRRLIRERERLAPIEEIGRHAGAEDRELRRVECRADARELLGRLPRPVASIVALRYGAELTSQEVGEAVGCTAAAVRQVTSRALRRLREEAAEEGRR